MTYYVYVIKSLEDEWFYVGLTQNIKRRLDEHNKGFTGSTKNHKPFMLVYSRKFSNRFDARDYERFLKISSNKEKLVRSLRLK